MSIQNPLPEKSYLSLRSVSLAEASVNNPGGFSDGIFLKILEVLSSK